MTWMLYPSYSHSCFLLMLAGSMSDIANVFMLLTMASLLLAFALMRLTWETSLVVFLEFSCVSHAPNIINLLVK